jgi:hypothetical protein
MIEHMFVEFLEAGVSMAPLVDAMEANVAAFDDEALLDLVAETARLRRVLDGLEARALVEIQSRKASERHLGLRVSTFLARETGVSLGQARTRLTTAEALAQLPLVMGELGDGRIGWERAKVVADATNHRNLGAVIGIQNELLDLSDSTTYSRFRADVAELGRLLDPDGPQPVDDTTNRLFIRPNAGGGIHLRGDLHGHAAQLVTTAIGSIADDLFRQHRKDGEQGGAFTDPRSRPTRSELQANALIDLCRGAATPEVRIVVPADHHTGDLICDPVLRPIVMSQLGEPLDIGRRSRRFTDAIRAAVEARDGGCIFPGCEHPPDHCDTHHIRPWQLGGATSTANAALLCRHHHRTVHRPGWALHTHACGPPTLTGPNGDEPTQRWGRTHPPPGPHGDP